MRQLYMLPLPSNICLGKPQSALKLYNVNVPCPGLRHLVGTDTHLHKRGGRENSDHTTPH